MGNELRSTVHLQSSVVSPYGIKRHLIFPTCQNSCLIRISHDFVRLRRIQDSHKIAICENNLSHNELLPCALPYLACSVRICCGGWFSQIITLDTISNPLPELGPHTLPTHAIRSAVAWGKIDIKILPLSQDRTLHHQILQPNRSVSNLVAYMNPQRLLTGFHKLARSRCFL